MKKVVQRQPLSICFIYPYFIYDHSHHNTSSNTYSSLHLNFKALRRHQSASLKKKHEVNIKKSCQQNSNLNHREKSINKRRLHRGKIRENFGLKMRIFLIFCVSILGVDVCACNNEMFQRNRMELSQYESQKSDASPNHDKHATDADRIVRRNSFLPPQTPSNGNYFREIISRNEGSNDNTIEYAIDPLFTSYVPQKQRKQQSEIHGSSSYRMTGEVQVKQGRLTGIVREMHVQSRLRNVDQFLGIPFAEAPVGSRRFMPPSSPLPWSVVKRANKLEAVCPQRLPNLNDPSGYNKGRYDQIKRLLPYLKRESEDCLYLNLYVASYGEC